MKLKDQKKLGILYLVLGAALFLVGLLTDAGEKTNWLSSFGSAIAVVGAARLLRVYRLTRDPDKAADYDASLTDELIGELSRFISDGEHAILLSSHIVSDIEKLCGRVAFLHKGRLILSEEKEALLAAHPGQTLEEIILDITRKERAL